MEEKCGQIKKPPDVILNQFRLLFSRSIAFFFNSAHTFYSQLPCSLCLEASTEIYAAYKIKDNFCHVLLIQEHVLLSSRGSWLTC